MIQWLEKYEAVWLFVILTTELIASLYTAYMVKKEYDYDKFKDDLKNQKRTKTQKKTTTKPSGETTTEEVTEVSEPTGDRNAG